MSMTSALADMFAEELAKLVERAPAIDGLNIADILQREATKMMKLCLGGEGDARDKACFEMLDEARRELIEEMPRARERLRQWHEQVGQPALDALEANQ